MSMRLIWLVCDPQQSGVNELRNSSLIVDETSSRDQWPIIFPGVNLVWFQKKQNDYLKNHP
jgi:hypothetical protein